MDYTVFIKYYKHQMKLYNKQLINKWFAKQSRYLTDKNKQTVK